MYYLIKVDMRTNKKEVVKGAKAETREAIEQLRIQANINTIDEPYYFLSASAKKLQKAKAKKLSGGGKMEDGLAIYGK